MLQTTAIGYLGNDCITKEVNGKKVINFSIAHTERFKDAQGNLKEKSTWLECAYWTDSIAVAEYLKQGQQVYVQGTPEARAYVNKAEEACASLAIRVVKIELLGGKKDAAPAPQAVKEKPKAKTVQGAKKEALQAAGIPIDDDLPF